MLNRNRTASEARPPVAPADADVALHWVPLATVAAELGELGLHDPDALERYLGVHRVDRLHGLVRVVSPATVTELAADLERYRERRAAINAKNAEALAAASRPIPAGKPAIAGEPALVALLVGEGRPEWHRGSVAEDLLGQRGVPLIELDGGR